MPTKPPRKPPNFFTPGPDDSWNEADADPQYALVQCAEIKRLIEDAPDYAWDKAGEFLEDVDAKVTAVSQTISRTNRVTPGQKKALDNWEAGIRKWHPQD